MNLDISMGPRGTHRSQMVQECQGTRGHIARVSFYTCENVIKGSIQVPKTMKVSGSMASKSSER